MEISHTYYSNKCIKNAGYNYRKGHSKSKEKRSLERKCRFCSDIKSLNHYLHECVARN